VQTLPQSPLALPIPQLAEVPIVSTSIHLFQVGASGKSLVARAGQDGNEPCFILIEILQSGGEFLRCVAIHGVHRLWTIDRNGGDSAVLLVTNGHSGSSAVFPLPLEKGRGTEIFRCRLLSLTSSSAPGGKYPFTA
jgi:hypothetical protein